MRTRNRALAATGLGVLVACALTVHAKEGPEGQAAPVGPVMMGAPGMWMPGGEEPDRVVGYAFGTAGVDDKVVRGAPYAAEATTEFVQTLADGNRISRKTTAAVFRDGQGRTRREQNLGAIVPLPGGAEPRTQVFINDPVAHASYVLDPSTRTVHKLEVSRLVVTKDDGPARRKVIEGAPAPGRASGPALAASGVPGPAIVNERTETFTMRVPGPDVAALPPPPMAGFALIERPKTAEDKAEPLGKQTIEGVEAEGTRTVVTIAAGEVGNDQPLQIVTERWYSPELQAVVMSRHSDPRFGETTYRLTSVVRGEPDRSLFEVPADYKVTDGPTDGDVVFRKIEKRKGRE
jgi:hypothetical protein